MFPPLYFEKWLIYWFLFLSTEINGNSRKGVGSVGTSEDGEESSSIQDEEEDTGIADVLGNIKAPEVIL